MLSRALCRMLLVVALVSAGAASAQERASDRYKPQWMHRLPVPSNPTFIYTVGFAAAPTLAEARDAAFAELLVQAGMEKGMTVTANYESSETERQVWHDDRRSEFVESTFRVNSTVKGRETTLHGMKIDEYWVRGADGGIRLSTLYARSQLDVQPRFDPVEITSRYGARGLWRSAIVPGWGQFHKGANLKGGLILGGCAALVAGIVFTESQRSDYARKIPLTHDAALKRAYATERDHFAAGRNICIGAAAALYVYNLIDAVAAPGARRVVVRRGGSAASGGRGYAFAPTVLDGRAPGLVAAVTF